jgi:glutamate racemase
MAEKRYSQKDQQKRVQDTLSDLRAKGVDAQVIHSTHFGGMNETLKHLIQNVSQVRDQSQAQTEANRKNMRRTSKEMRDRK